MRPTLFALSSALGIACASGSSGPAPSPSPSPAPPSQPVAAVMRQAADAAPPKAPEPAKSAESDIAGSYGVSLSYGGQPIDATLYLGKREDGTWGGSLYVEMAGTIPFNSLTVKENVVQATLSSPDGSVVSMEFKVEGVDLTGAWRSSGGDGSQVRGRKLP